MEQTTDAYRIAVAQNIATNGRLFCILLAAANYSAGVHITVAGCSLPVALAWLSDLVQSPALKRHLAVASIASAIGLAIATLVNCW